MDERRGSDAPLLVAARAVRGFGDGFVSVLLVGHLAALGFGPVEIGAVVTATLLGSAALTLVAGLVSVGARPRRLLLWACLLMAATGVGFASLGSFWPLVLVALVGTLNPSAGDVSVFLPVEQAMLAGTTGPERRTGLFARYNLAGAAAGAVGALASAAFASAPRWGFVAYAGLAAVVAGLYTRLSPPEEAPTGPVWGARRSRSLGRSRPVVLRLAALFSLDSAGGGFVVQSLLVLWLFRRFGLSVEAAGVLFFAVNLLGGASQLVSSRLAARVGLVRTMVFTHLPANVLLMAAALAPRASVAIALLLARSALSQMDVPARQSLVMSLVPPEERPAAAAVTNVPRSLAAAATPFLAGAMLARSSFGWPLVLGGALKVAYDLALLAQFRDVQPEEPVGG